MAPLPFYTAPTPRSSRQKWPWPFLWPKFGGEMALAIFSISSFSLHSQLPNQELISKIKKQIFERKPRNFYHTIKLGSQLDFRNGRPSGSHAKSRIWILDLALGSHQFQGTNKIR